MAIVHTNNVVKGFSGTIGKLVFRQVHGQTIVSGRPSRHVKQSQQQKDNRERFKNASAYAKSAMLNPERKAYYWRKAKKLNLPNAYTAAISDYMRKSEIKEIDTRQYKGQAGNTIRIKASKKDFAINKVKVILRYADGTILESAYADKDHDIFLYKATKDALDKGPVTIQIMIDEHEANRVMVEKEIMW